MLRSFVHPNRLIRVLAWAGIAVTMCALPALRPAGARAGGGCHLFSPDAVAGGAPAAVAITDLCFSPAVLQVPAGTSVRFTNRDPMAHVVTGAALRWGAFRQLPPSADFTAQFNEPGSYPYACELHVGMSGVIIVGAPPEPRTAASRLSLAPQPGPSIAAIEAAPPDRMTSATSGGGGAWAGALFALLGASAATVATSGAFLARGRR